LAVKPKLVLPLGASTLFQPAFFMVASDPAWDSDPFHALLMVCPSGVTQVTVQPYMVEVVGLATVTCAWKPPGHELVMVYVARHGVVVGGGAVEPMPVTSPLPPSNTTSEQP
jgi:hypothetical protein